MPPVLSRRQCLGFAAGGVCGSAIAGRAQVTPVAASAAIGSPLDMRGLELSFNTDFADPEKPVFRTAGGPFSTRFERFSGARTLAPNKEQQLYVDPSFVPSTQGTDSGGRNDAPAGSAPPAGLNPFRITDGAMVITATETPPALLKMVDRPYVSGMLSTDMSFAQQYGYFEIRARLPRGRGLWPAFWLFGTTDAYPVEIDVMEALGHETTTFYQSVHPNPARGKGQVLPIRTGFDYTLGMHSYGVLWTPERIMFYADRRLTALLDGAPFRNEVPAYMMANLAVGGNWGGNPDPATRFPAEMQIAHIQAYKLG